MSVKTFGMIAFRHAVSNGMELAGLAASYIQESRLVELLNPASLGVVCFRVNPADAEFDDQRLEKANRIVWARVFWEDRAFISSTLLRGRFSLRVCIVNYGTSWPDVRATLEAIERFGREALDQATEP